MQVVTESAKFLNITGTNAQLSNGFLTGIFVAQASGSPTIKVADTKGNIANTFTPTAGVFYPMPCQFIGALTVTIGGTVDATIFHST